MTSDPIVIVGAGQAAAQASASLRQWGYDGGITVIGEESHLPYQRPPLSKAFLKGELAAERLFLKPVSFYEDNHIDMILGTPVEALDRGSRSVRLTNGMSIKYGKLILATGSRPRTLPVPGASLDGVLPLRGIDDVDDLRPRLDTGGRLVIVGAGYIGLEVAAVARQLGLDVTVLEAMDRVLARVTSPGMSDFYQSVHRDKGVDIRLNARLESFVEGDHGRVAGVKLADGEVIDCNVVLVGIGILPNQELATGAGIATKDGILVDRDARTNDPDIYAIGDCARRPLVHYGRDGRLESVHNAIEQGKIAASHILGRPRPKEDAPWFWSDQYDLKLQIAGLSAGADEVIVRGTPGEGPFATFYLRNGRLISVDAVNAAPEYMVGKKLIAQNAMVASGALQDTSTNMKDVAAKAMA